jgi:hypothetical protein
MKRIAKVRPGTVLGVIAIVIALAGTAVAAGNLKLGDFTTDSRDKLAGTGVIQYAAQSYTTGKVSADPAKPTLQTFSVKCELSKKATSGGFKWTGTTPPAPDAYQLLDAYPNGGGYVVRLYILKGSAADQPLSVYSNCVKSRAQRGTPPV